MTWRLRAPPPFTMRKLTGADPYAAAALLFQQFPPFPA